MPPCVSFAQAEALEDQRPSSSGSRVPLNSTNILAALLAVLIFVLIIVAAPLVGNAEAVAGAVVGGNATSGTEGLAL